MAIMRTMNNHADVSTIWGDVWLRTVGNWDDVPQQKKLDLIHECWQVYDVQDNIYKGRVNLNDYRYLLDTPAERFMDHVAIPLITVGSMFTPATAPVALSSSARTAAVVVPKLKQIATALGVAEVLEETMTFFSKKAGGDAPKPRAERDFGGGEYWDKLITDKKSATSSGLKGKQADEVAGDLLHLKRLVKGEIRADSAGNFYKFDRAHQSAKVHLEKIVKRPDGFYNVAEVDPVTGVVTKTLSKARKL